MKIFKNELNQIKNVWWIIIFFITLAAITIPLILISKHFNWEITMVHQALVVICVNIICQSLRKKSFTEITGSFDKSWLKKLLHGIVIGSLLMLFPALILYILGHIYWSDFSFDWYALISISVLSIGVSIAEEFLFRGFLFQRLINWIGVRGAQVVIASYFLLTHMNNPGMTGGVKMLASINIFLASIMFGLAYIKSKSIAMPIGIHFASNWVQGVLLGFGVSGYAQYSIFKLNLNTSHEWLTGGTFGLEASLPGLIFVMMTLAVLYKRRLSFAKNNK